jgi:hypothetical protein
MAGSLSELNTRLTELDLATPEAPCDYFGVTACDEHACLYVATVTMVWAPPGEYHTMRLCDIHRAAGEERLAEASWPVTVLDTVLDVPQLFYVKSSHDDIMALTRVLVGEDVPAEVFPQPKCTKCKARICVPPGQLRWATAAWSFKCQRNGVHLPGYEDQAHKAAAKAG